MDREINQITLDMLLGKLNDQDRDAIVLWFIEGYTLKEVADFINKKYCLRGQKPLGSRAIGTRIRKILEKLRELGGESPSEGDLYKRKRLKK